MEHEEWVKFYITWNQRGFVDLWIDGIQAQVQQIKIIHLLALLTVVITRAICCPTSSTKAVGHIG